MANQIKFCFLLLTAGLVVANAKMYAIKDDSIARNNDPLSTLANLMGQGASQKQKQFSIGPLASLLSSLGNGSLGKPVPTPPPSPMGSLLESFFKSGMVSTDSSNDDDKSSDDSQPAPSKVIILRRIPQPEEDDTPAVESSPLGALLSMFNKSDSSNSDSDNNTDSASDSQKDNDSSSNAPASTDDKPVVNDQSTTLDVQKIEETVYNPRTGEIKKLNKTNYHYETHNPVVPTSNEQKAPMVYVHAQVLVKPESKDAEAAKQDDDQTTNASVDDKQDSSTDNTDNNDDKSADKSDDKSDSDSDSDDNQTVILVTKVPVEDLAELIKGSEGDDSNDVSKDNSKDDSKDAADSSDSTDAKNDASADDKDADNKKDDAAAVQTESKPAEATVASA